MNFKRYHVSRNISDVNTVTNTGWGTTNSDMLSVLNSLEAGTYSFSALFTLTERNDTSDNSTYGIVFTNTISSVSNNSIKWNDSGVGTIKSYAINFDVTTQMVGKFTNAYFYGCGINQVGRTGRADVSNIMLNTGSQPLPYEPYSSEVWHDTPHYIHKTDTDILTTLPADIYVNDTTATVGLKGNMEQASGVSPTTPIQPQECGERTGNLAYKIIENANISADGLIAAASGYNIMVAKVAQGQAYSGTGYVYAFFNDEPDIRSTSYNESRVVNTFKNVTAPISGYVAVRYGTSENPMINEGSTALPYEPWGIKILISSANTTTPVYLGEVESTRKIKKLVLTGQEGWQRTANGAYYLGAGVCPNDYLKTLDETIVVCTHYTAQKSVTGSSNVNNNCISFFGGSGLTYEMYIGARDVVDTETFKSYLAQQYSAGTPVCVWYVLATETTGIVNEPLRKIGDYADEVSGITIPTIAGANTISVGTTLQPSEVTVNYKGWHPVADVHEADNGAWT